MAAGTKNFMRGLFNFISEIRETTSKEQEKNRVDKELGNIRAKFTSRSLTSYDRRKYVWKLLYIYMLGYDVEIGHIEALNLLKSKTFAEKNTGYIACSMLLHDHHELLPLTVQAIRDDINNSASEIHQSLALALVANLGGQELADSLIDDVQKCLFAAKTRIPVKKKAALCLMRLLRKTPENIPGGDFPNRILTLYDSMDLGLNLCATSLLIALVSYSSKGFEGCLPKIASTLDMLVTSKQRSTYKYYLTLCPWLQVKCLKLLQYFPPSQNPAVAQKLNSTLTAILTNTQMTTNPNKNNADYSVFFEVINLIIHYGTHNVTDLHTLAVSQLSGFITAKEPNFRYLGLETMSKLSRLPSALPTIRQNKGVVLNLINDADVSIRKRALDVLFVLGDETNAQEITEELLKYLATASYELREELVLKLAILAEKFAADLKWYLDVILRLINVAGDFVGEDIWYRAVQIVTNNVDLQDYAATTCYKYLQSPSIHEAGLKVGSYVIGEFGHTIRDASITPDMKLGVLLAKFKGASNFTKALIMSACSKIANAYPLPSIKERVNALFKSHLASGDPELQQRACEYYAMNNHKNDKLMIAVFDVMPDFPERSDNLLLKRLRAKHQPSTADRDVFTEDGERKEADAGAASDSDDGDDEEGEGGENSDEGETDGPDTAFPPASSAISPAAVINNKGAVYNSRALQIGVQMQLNKSQCKAILFLGNKTDDPLTNVTVSWPAVEACSLQIQGKPSPPFDRQPFEVAAKKQQTFLMVLDCMRPFVRPPPITVSFAHNGSPTSLVLTIPLLLCSFVEPKDVTIDQSKAAWAKLDKEARGNRRLDHPADIKKLIELVENGLHMRIVEGADPNPLNAIAAGTFNTSTPQGDGFVTVSCLIRLETKPGLDIFCATVHSANQTVSDGLLESITAVTGASLA